VPAGLDGNPDPIVTPARDAVLDRVVDRITGLTGPRVRVGVDGASGAGKSTFADELAGRLAARRRVVVRSTTDSFHRPRTDRFRRGATSGDGFYLDSYDLRAIVEELLDPFAAGATQVRTAAFDEPADRPLDTFAEGLPEEAVLVFDGLFLLRPELRGKWDLTVHLVADRRREAAWRSYLEGGLPADPAEREAEVGRRLERARWPRYTDGWQRYVDDCAPLERADVVLDNDDLAAPSYHRPMAATYGVFCPECNEVFGQYESLDDAREVAELHCETSGHDCRTDPIQTTGDPGSLPE
jgi:uridine kinase